MAQINLRGKVLILLYSLLASSLGVAETPSARAITFETVKLPNLGYYKAVFTPNESPALPIRLSLPGESLESVQLKALVFDFWGQSVGEAAIRPGTESGTFIISPQPVPIGWYRIELSLTSKGVTTPLMRKIGSEKSAENYHFIAFSIVPPPHSKEEVPDSPFGVMTALNPVFMPVAAQVDLAELSGCRWVREIIGWARINPAEGQFKLEPFRSNAEAMSRKGLLIETAIQTTPSWLLAPNQDKFSFPENLLGAYAAARQMAMTNGPAVRAYEIWNEPDISHYACQPPDRYAATIKAMSLGFSSVKNRPTILGGVFARDPRVGGYATTLQKNNIGDYLDGYSFHTYQPVSTGTFATVLDSHQQILSQLRMDGKPLWLTETALAYARNTIPDPHEAMPAQVRQLVESYMLALSKGIRPVFWFIIRPYFGNNHTQFGLVDSSLSPLPAYSALAVMTHHLGIGEFKGSCTYKDSTLYLFNNGQHEVAVIIGKEGRNKLSIPPIEKSSQAWNVMGQSLVIEQDKDLTQVSSHGYAVYVHNPGWLHLVKPAPSTVPITDTASSKTMRRDVVIQAIYPDRYMTSATTKVQENWDGLATNWAPRGYEFQRGEKINVKLQVYNFGENPATVTLTGNVPEGCRIEPQKLTATIPPMKQSEWSVIISTPDTEQSPAFWTFEGVVDGQPLSPCASWWTQKKTISNPQTP